MVRRLWKIGLMVVLAGLLVACGQSDDQAPAGADGGGETMTAGTEAQQEAPRETPTHFRYARGQDLEGWGTYNHSGGVLYDLQRNIIEPLVEYNWDTHDFDPVLAETWDYEGDGRTWVFNLRRGVYFHDGSELTADDVIHSFRRMRDDPDTNQLEAWTDVESITARDDYTVVFNLEVPRPDFLRQIYSYLVTSKTTFDEVGRDEANRKLIGTGPFTFVEWRPGSYFIMDRNDDYWDTSLNSPFERITYRPIIDKSAAIAALEAGEVDLIDFIPSHEIDRLEAREGIEISHVRGDRIWFIGTNPGQSPMDDVRVRRAVQHAIDVDTIIDTVLEGRATRVPQYMSEGTFGYVPDLELYDYDPERARELLEEAGYPDGIHDLDFYAVGWDPSFLSFAQAAQPMLAEAGIHVNIKTPERGVFSDLFTRGEMALFHQARGQVTIAGLRYLRQYFETGVTNRLLYSNPEVDELLIAASSTFDDEERAQLTQDAMRRVYEDSPMMPLLYMDVTYAARDWVDFEPTPDEKLNAYRIKVK